ncbi:MAG: LacI family DNA-binding transcriptional regulator [Kineosporiaceae bacterium]|nr:LacI family DNA-binding transcriptional regulator [Kineosporiaceae bacterium]MBK7622522.1 LacI family DNA-binding transcriptional regulator [Kineosporiaceae bacterium]MBK8078435.1 LacI family DNA-binding transcriptional regulator [Kineosporiaceae bacterium]
MRVRLSDIAARAKVSEATVSRVLNDKPGVSADNRRAILATMERLGYERPTRMRAKRAGLIGLIVPELDNPVFPSFAQRIESALAHHGYTPVLCSQSQGVVHEDEYVRMLIDRHVAGIIFVSGIHANSDTDPQRYVALREQGLPIVLVNGYVPGVDAPFLSNDDAATIDLSVQHLSELGHRRIGLAMGPERYVPVLRKVAAFDLALRRHVDPTLGPAEVRDLVEHSVFSVDGGAEATGALIERGVTAVICGSDVMALGAFREARARGLDLPGELSVVGSDGIPYAEYFAPALTTVRSPIEDMADAAAQALLAEIAGHPAPRAEYMFRPQLLVRSSTAAPDGVRHHSAVSHRTAR